MRKPAFTHAMHDACNAQHYYGYNVQCTSLVYREISFLVPPFTSAWIRTRNIDLEGQCDIHFTTEAYFRHTQTKVVSGPTGLEPATSTVTKWYSNLLSYSPIRYTMEQYAAHAMEQYAAHGMKQYASHGAICSAWSKIERNREVRDSNPRWK